MRQNTHIASSIIAAWLGLTACSIIDSDRRAESTTQTTTKKQTARTSDLLHWQLIWHNELDYPNAELIKTWWSQNAPSLNLHSNRWRENVVVSEGI